MAQANPDNIIVKSINTVSNLFAIAEYIESNIQAKSNPVVLYIGVGTYMCRFQKDSDGNDFIPLEDSQQFPPTLQSLYQSHPDLEFYIILIDPYLENPPYITKDPNVKNILNNPIFVKSMFNSEVELFSNPRLKVFVIRDNIGIRDLNYHSYDGVADIKDNFTYFNDICIQNNILYIYHDFSGANLRPLCTYFNHKIKNNLEHIIYGFGNGYIDDCIVNLLDAKTQLATYRKRWVKRDMICCYNIDYIILNNINIDEYVEIFNINNIHIITALNELLINKIYYEINNDILYILRNIKQYHNQIITNQFIFDNSMLFHKNRYIKDDIITNINELIKNSDNNIFDKVKYMFSNMYTSVLKFILKNTQYENYDSKTIFDLITLNDNSYLWCNSLKSILNK
jgi:hypothetical protein